MGVCYGRHRGPLATRLDHPVPVTSLILIQETLWMRNNSRRPGQQPADAGGTPSKFTQSLAAVRTRWPEEQCFLVFTARS